MNTGKLDVSALPGLGQGKVDTDKMTQLRTRGYAKAARVRGE